jgi:hypothetical protein
VTRRLAAILGALTLTAGAVPASAVASAPPVRIAAAHVGAQQSRLGRGFGGGFSSRPSYRSYRRAPYGYRRSRGHPFLRGLFVGWLLSHLFRGGFPLFPFLLLGIVVLMLRRRRRRPAYGPW